MKSEEETRPSRPQYCWDWQQYINNSLLAEDYNFGENNQL